MADLRIAGGAGPAAAQPTQRSESVRAAQRAFFQAALNGASATQAAQPTAQAHPVAKTPSAQTLQAAAAEPTRYARPGSILDIKI